MESYEDDVQFPLPDRPPSPPPQPKLKRLKKSSAAAPPRPHAPPQAVSTSPAPGSEQIDENVIPADDLNHVFSSPLPDPRDLELEREDEEADPSRKEKSAKKRLIMEDEPGPSSALPGLEDTGEKGINDGDLYGAKAEGGVADGSRKMKSAKKRLNMEDEGDAVHTYDSISEKGRMEGDVDPLFSVPEPRDLEWEREWERESKEGLTKEKSPKAKENESDGLRKEKSAKKRLSLDDDDESPKKKKRRHVKPKPKDSVREAKRVEKERKEQLDRIHAESQRLLRETKDATFKPVSVVHKPISSILEKIRLRKLEVMRQCSLLNDSYYVPQTESLVDEDSPNADMTEPPIDAKEDQNARMTVSDIKDEGDSRVDGLESQSGAKEDDSARVVGVESRTDTQDDDIVRMTSLESQSDANKDDRTGKVDLKSQSKAKENELVDFDAHTADDTSCKSLQDLHGTVPSIKGDHNCSQLSDKDTNPSGDDQCDTSEDILVPSLSGSNSKDDYDDDSSSDDDNDKENTNPCPRRAADMDSYPDNDKENVNPRPRRASEMDSYPKGGLAKAFLDDEAEEEDDSDHDMMRFQENEDDESDEEEELNDLIATGFEEAPVDKEKRNQLHQKWLEQQDTAATDNVLQRLKARHKQRQPALALEDDDDQESEDGSEDEGSYDLPTQDGVKKSSRKSKQMFAEMFNDGNDIYVPSDDEETEQTLIRQRFLKQTVETSIVSPLDDQNSKEVFGLIKKLNVAPDFKKKGKTATSSFDMLMMGGSSNSSSKSSFLGRTTSSSLSSSHKQGPTVRAYIFGRDDSNSRSNMSSASENVLDLGHKDDQAAKATSAKAIGSQFKPPASRIKTDDKSGPGSLFQILRQSSAQFDKRLETRNGGVAHTMTDSQVAHQFSVFKVGKKFSKVETRV